MRYRNSHVRDNRAWVPGDLLVSTSGGTEITVLENRGEWITLDGTHDCRRKKLHVILGQPCLLWKGWVYVLKTPKLDGNA
jgi:hypothetical protein